VLPGVAGGPAPAVDADGQSPEGIFPAALEQALAQPVQAPTGSAPPLDAGQVLPVQVMKAVAEPGVIALPVTAGAIDIPVPEAGPASPTVAAAPDPAAVVDALDDIATGQNAVVAAAVQAPAVSGVPIRTPVGNSPTAMAGVIKVNVAQPPRAQGKQAEQATDAFALAPALAETVAAPALAEGTPVAGHKPARRLAAADSTVVSPPQAELTLPVTVTGTPAAGQGAEAGTSAAVAGNGREGTSLPRPAERPAVPVTMPTVSGGSEAALAAQATGSPDPSVPSVAVPGNELAALISSAPRMAAPNSAPSLELPLAATPGSPQFSHELGERLLWLVREGVHEARLQLNPRDLGPIEVRLGISDGAAQISFSAQHAGTAAAVQQSLPQLREMLAQQGLQLGQADVSQREAGAGQQTPQQERSAGGDARGAAGLGLDTPIIGERVRVIGRGLVDAYA
jgi:flagellar hook-length control protein FliK